MSSNSQQGGRRNKLNEMLSVSHTGDLFMNQWWVTDIHSVCLVHRQVMKANIVVVTIIVPVVLLRFSIWAILFSALSCNNNTIKHSATHTTFLLTLCARTHARTHTRARAFNVPFSGTTRVSRQQKGKTNLDFTEARDSGWQWHQLGRMQVCTSLQTITPAPHHSVFYRPDALPATQQTAWNH